MAGIVDKIKRKIKTITFKKIPVEVPVLYGELLKGRTAIITGGTSGIGLEIAKAFLHNGASVIITGRNEKRIASAVSVLQSECQENTNSSVFGFALDNCDVKNMQSAFDGILKAIGNRKIDIFVNNAGVISSQQFGSTDEQTYDQIMDTDLKGTYFFSQIAAEYMIHNNIHGNILNVSSSSAIRPAESAYSVAKWGVKGLTLGMARKLSRNGIVVNAIAPGPTATKMLQQDGIENINRMSSPSERFAASCEIANLAVVLVSSIGKMVNGDTLYATGGCGLLTLDDYD